MFRRLVVIGAVLLAGCGSYSSEPQINSDDASPAAGGGVGISLAAVSIADTGTVKAAVNVTNLVDTPVRAFNADAETTTSVTCSADAGCADYDGATCKNGLCVTTAPVRSLLYAKNQSGSNRNDPVKVPCDGRTYSVDVYGSDQGTTPFTIKDFRISVPFIVTSACNVTSVTGAALTTGDLWPASAKTAATPTLLPSTIYVGLPAPYDKYAVQAQNLAYPWSNAWSIKVGSTGAFVPESGARAMLDAPATAGTGSLHFTAEFSLDRSLVLGDEKWVIGASADKTLVNSGTINVP
jgi:hypothetical protein